MRDPPILQRGADDVQIQVPTDISSLWRDLNPASTTVLAESPSTVSGVIKRHNTGVIILDMIRVRGRNNLRQVRLLDMNIYLPELK